MIKFTDAQIERLVEARRRFAEAFQRAGASIASSPEFRALPDKLAEFGVLAREVLERVILPR